MKHPFLYLSLLAAVAVWSVPTVWADTTEKMTAQEKREAKRAEREAKKAARKASADSDSSSASSSTAADDQKKDPKAVAKALKSAKFKIYGKFNKSAQYFLYCPTNSAVTGCEEFVQKIASKAKAMKKAKVDVILIAHDSSPEVAQDFLKKNGCSCAMVHKSQEVTEGLPGYNGESTIPYVLVVDGSGEVVAKGDDKIIDDWKSYTIDRDKE
ncbi:MAG: hypothetical protein ACI4OS_02720 [Akkermansia sp.]